MAKDLVRTRSYITKFYTMRSQLQGVALKLETAKSTEAMTSAMSSTTKSMQSMAKSMNLPKLNAMMMEFVKESEKMDMQQETIGDAMDDVMEGDQDEEEEDKIVNQVLDEIGIDINGAIPEAPAGVQQVAAPAAPMVVASTVVGGGSGPGAGGGGGPSAPTAPGGGGDSKVNDLEARLNNLRRE